MVNGFITFLNKLETSGVISLKANQKIQGFLDTEYNFFGRLFLVLCGIMGALFAAAGIFSLISHNWDDLPKHVKGFLSLVPTLVGLYFYYKAVFKHRKSVVWVESASLFLMLMIGASISLVAQTYQLDGDFNKFVKVWLALTIPLFYVARASGIALFYLGLSFVLIFPRVSFGFLGFIPSGYNYNENWYWFYIFFAAFLPHLIMNIKGSVRKQGPRAIYLGWIAALTFYLGLPAIFQGGWVFWAMTIVVIYQFIGHKYYSENNSMLAKPFQFVSYWALFHSFLVFSDKYNFRNVLEEENLIRFGDFEIKQQTFIILGAIAMIASVVIAKLFSDKKTALMKYIIYLPGVLVLLIALHYIDEIWDFDMYWLGWLIINLFVLFFGISAMIYGNRDKKFAPLFYGLFLTGFLLWFRYYDTDISFWLKGLIFLGVGGFLFFINYVVSEDVDTGAEAEVFPEETDVLADSERDENDSDSAGEATDENNEDEII